jgi:hypothetical protein
LHGINKTSDTFNTVKNAVKIIGGFKKISSAVTDDAKSKVRKNIGFNALFRKYNSKVPVIH